MKKKHEYNIRQQILIVLVAALFVACLIFALLPLIYFESSPNEILFFGDSITWGYIGDLETYEPERFSEIVSEHYGTGELNFGVCGSMITNIGNDGSSMTERVSTLPKNADLCIIGGVRMTL